MKSNIRNEIEQYLALSSKNSAYRIEALGDEYPGWVIKQNNSFGVFMPYEGQDIYESFHEATLHSDILNVEGLGECSVLMLTSNNNSLRNEFSVLCEDFISSGESGKKRLSIIKNPLGWWGNWKNLLGNAESDKMVFDIVGELWAVLKLLELGRKPYWSAAKLGSHDIEISDPIEESYEVKTTIKKEASNILINPILVNNETFGELLICLSKMIEELLIGLSKLIIILRINKIKILLYFI